MTIKSNGIKELPFLPPYTEEGDEEGTIGGQEEHGLRNLLKQLLLEILQVPPLHDACYL